MNPQMFNSFLDGTKSAIEMAAIANATGLDVAADGLPFPPCGVDDLPHVLRPRDVAACWSGRAWWRSSPRSSATAGRCSAICAGASTSCSRRRTITRAPASRQYGLKTDATGRYAAMYKPYHLIGLELGISVLSAALRGEPTGQPHGFRGDVAAVAKRDLRAGEMLDGEGGYTVWGKLMPARTSLSLAALPIGVAHRLRLVRDLAKGDVLRWDDVETAGADLLTKGAIEARREMEEKYAAGAVVA